MALILSLTLSKKTLWIGKTVKISMMMTIWARRILYYISLQAMVKISIFGSNLISRIKREKSLALYLILTFRILKK